MTEMDTITKSEYDEKLDAMAERLAEECQADEQDTRECILDGAMMDVSHDNWFARSYYGPTLYGSIMEHADWDTEFSDWEVACDAQSPEKAVKGLAQIAMENDLSERALEARSETGEE